MDFTKCVTLVGALLLVGVVIPSEACDCPGIVYHPQWYFCNHEAAIKVKITKAIKSESEFDEAPPVGYESQTIKVLKGDAALENSKYVDNEKEDPSCAYSHPEQDNSVMYLMTGSIHEGNVRVSHCSYKIPWSFLSDEQKLGFEGIYKQGCDKCKIISCEYEGCEKSNNECVLEQYEGGDSSNQEDTKACLPIGEDSCAWKTIE